MSVIRSSQYPGRWNTPDADAPQGSGKNRTAPGSNDGSYFDQVWFNDMDSLHQALFIASGVSPNGVQDVGTASQIFDALINNRWSAIGNYSQGTVVTASDGKLYYCNQTNGRDTSVSDPTTDLLDNWREFPYEKVTTGSSVAYKYFNGDLVMTGSVTPSGGIASVSYPVAPISVDANTVSSNSLIGAIPAQPSDTPVTSVITNTITTSGFSVAAYTLSLQNSTSSLNWYIEGRWA